MYEDHYRTCSYCNKGLASASKRTIRVKSASTREKRRKLVELGNMIKGINIRTKSGSFVENNTRARKQGLIEKAFKLKELRKMVKGL
jgi:hypothetical protein